MANKGWANKDSAGNPRPDSKKDADHPTEANLETAILHALGALAEPESRAFEKHLASGCPGCTRAANDYRGLVADLSQAASSGSPPPPSLRSRVLQSIAGQVSTPGASAAAGTPGAGGAARPAPAAREQKTGAPAAGKTDPAVQVWKQWKPRAAPAGLAGFFVQLASEGDWQETSASGVRAKPLFIDEKRNCVTMLVRMDPGSSYPGHRHAETEECFVLEGELQVGGAVLRAGDYQRAEAHSLHGVQSTETGCLLFIISSKGDELTGSA